MPDNNVTIGNINFTDNTIRSTTNNINIFPNIVNGDAALTCKVNYLFLGTGSTSIIDGDASITNIIGAINIVGQTRATLRGNTGVIITSNSGLGTIEINGILDMKTKNITNVGTINELVIPRSNFVGVDDTQILTKKTIHAGQLVNNTVDLAKLSQIPTKTILGNNTDSTATPLALTVAEVKYMLGIYSQIQVVNTITLSGDVTGFGSLTIPTTISSGTITLLKMAALSANTIIGNNTGSSATPIALSITQVKSMLSLELVENTALSTWAGSTNITTIADNAILTAKIVNNAVTLEKMAELSANTIIGNNTGSSATPKALTVNEVISMLGVTAGTITLTGDVTGTGTGSFATTIADNSVTLTRMAALSANTIIGNNTGSSTTPIALSTTQVKTMLSLDLVENTALSTWTGSTNITTIANGTVTLDRMTALAANTIIGNNTGSSTTPKALTANDVRTMLGLTTGTITLTGDVTGSGVSSFATTIASGSVTLAKMATIAAISIMGNNTVVSATPAALTIAQVKTMLNLTGTNSGDQTITLTGDVTGTGTGSFATTIASGSVTLAKMANFASNCIMGNNTGINAAPLALTPAQTKSLLALNLVENTTLSTWAGSTNLSTIGALTSLSVSGITISSSGITSTGTIAITPNGGASPVEIWAPLNMKTNSITNIGSINTFAIPTSAFVGINDFQTLTNKTINASQLVDGSVTLAKMATISATTIVGNSAGASATPAALTTAQVKTMLNLTGTNSGDQTITLTGDVTGTGTGSFATTIAANTVTFAKMATLAANSIIGNNTGATATPLALSTTQVKTLLSLNNVENTALSTWAGSTNITTIGTLSSINISGLSTVANITATTGGTDTTFILTGTTTSGLRQIIFQQNGVSKTSIGLSSSLHYYVFDHVASADMMRLTISGGSTAFKLPTYTTNGTLSTTGGVGTVSVSSDRRLKQNEEILSPGTSLQQVLNLQPKTYVWKDYKDRTRIGFIAQDVETVIPDAIDGKKYEYEFVRDGAGPGVEGEIRIDEEGNPVLDYDKPRYRGLDQCAILAVLVSAFQEFHNNITSSLTSINTRLTTLENIVNNINSPPQT
jgi:hypothetical protein